MLELAGVGHRYVRSRWVFRGLSLRLSPGTVTAVLGPNGRGKTTLLRCAAGLLTPTEGAVRRDGPVGYVPQVHGATFGYRVLDMVLMGRVRHVATFGVPGRRDRRAAWDAMARVGITHLAERPVTELSGGEAQLVLVARAVASGCQVLALDEPATGLDLHNQVRVLNLMRELARQGMTLLATTHHPEHALHVADGAVLMHGPTEIETGAAADLLTGDRLSALYGIDVRIARVDQDGRPCRVLVTDYRAS
ncbi:MAG: ABC transporter ATP-binding protein [Streptosporangiales bacterium]|nr:ABC transporter ATP-binding protein [Streptosporangiales bacterium]